jgi:hypothetical protein
MQRERVAQVLMAPGYLRKLLDLFRVSHQHSSRHYTGAVHQAAHDDIRQYMWQCAKHHRVQHSITYHSIKYCSAQQHQAGTHC